MEVHVNFLLWRVVTKYCKQLPDAFFGLSLYILGIVHIQKEKAFFLFETKNYQKERTIMKQKLPKSYENREKQRLYGNRTKRKKKTDPNIQEDHMKIVS